jgi:hypothetical protein
MYVAGSIPMKVFAVDRWLLGILHYFGALFVIAPKKII